MAEAATSGRRRGSALGQEPPVLLDLSERERDGRGEMGVALSEDVPAALRRPIPADPARCSHESSIRRFRMLDRA
jgi:hypothetical protein